MTTLKNSIKVVKSTNTLADGTKPVVHSYNYMTSEKNFKILDFNRGKDNGFSQPRVDGIKEVMTDGNFIWLFSTIKVIERRGRLLVIDGSNRIMAVRQLIEEGILPKSFKIIYTELDSPRFKGKTEKQIIEMIAKLNDYDPRWKESEHFQAAVSVKYATALEFTKVFKRIGKLDSTLSYYNIKNKKKTIKIPKNAIMAIASQSFEPIKGNKSVRFGDFNNDDVANHMKTKQFETDFNAFIELLEYVKDWNTTFSIRPSKVYERVLALVYGKNIRINFTSFVDALKSNKRTPKTVGEVAEFVNLTALSI